MCCSSKIPLAKLTFQRTLKFPLQVQALPLRPDKTSQWGEQESQAGKRVRERPCSYCLGTCMKTKLNICYMCTGSPRSSSCMLFGWWFIIWEPTVVQASWLFWSSCRVTIPSISLTLFFNSSKSLSELSLKFGCGYLHLFQSAAGWSLTEDSYARLPSASITEYQ